MKNLLSTLLLISLLLPMACSGGCGGEGASGRGVEAASGMEGEGASGRVGEGLVKCDTMEISKDMLLGRVDPAGSGDFVLIDRRYANRQGMYMHHEAYKAFLQMHAAAAAEGVALTIVSAMRTFDHQKRIWNDKWNGRQILHGNIRATDIADVEARALEILRFSSMPGTSRHHWGTDIDLNNLNNSYFESGPGKKEYDWMVDNAGKFGFCQPYTAHGTGRKGGYEEEKWHWSYEPLASLYLRAYFESISYEDIKGFDGWETAVQIDVIKGYVMEVGCGRKAVGF